jgi:NAD(P)-dependent dehydrogenase (short-subunit alcohol dehydrogenase family)
MGVGFAGQVALVTGAGSGIGEATALAFAREGAAVALSDIDVVGGERVAEAIRAAGGRAVFVAADVAREDDVRALVERTVAEFGRLDCACNNAGIGGPSAPTGEYPGDGWERVIGVNLTGVFWCMRHEIPAMLAGGGGSIVNMASILGTVGFANAPAYVAAKHGVIGLTKTLAVEWGTSNVRCNAICPGWVKTDLNKAIWSNDTMAAEFVKDQPIKRWGEVSDITGAAVWLASDASAYVTGTAIVIDGGQTTA